jgi:hypothetical protein
MPTNSDYDGFFSGIDGIPMFTYGMIASTIVVLSYMTFMEESLPDEIEPDSSVLSAAITSPIPPATLTEEEGEEPIPFIPQEEPAANELVPEENEQPPSSLQEEVINDEDSPPPSEPKQSIGGKNKKRRITKRRKPQA